MELFYLYKKIYLAPEVEVMALKLDVDIEARADGIKSIL
jgi:hypothetical protein